MRTLLLAAVPGVVVLAAACSGGHGGSSCSNAGGTLHPGVTTLSWDDGTAAHSVRGQHFTISDNGQTFSLDTQPMWEAVRFDLTRPAKVWGYKVTWNHLGPYAAQHSHPLEAGLYPDFGYTGSDFWSAQPYFSGSRCVGDLEIDGSVDYVMKQPLVVDQPGLVYVAHHSDHGDDPTFGFDNSASQNPCTTFAGCHSSIDLDRAEANLYFNGIAFPFPYDYVVSLYVEYTEAPPATTLFTRAAGDPQPVNLRLSWGDYDNDGWDDLLTMPPTLFHNNGDGTFADVTSSAGLTLGYAQTAGGWGDYDNDGCLDLFIASAGDSLELPNHLFKGDCAGHFTDVTATASAPGTNLAGADGTTCTPPTPYTQNQAASFVDLDGDGFVDLYVSNYNCGAPGSPDFEDFVYHNEGNGTFSDWSGTRGFVRYGTASRGANAVDLDQDGDVDVLVNNYDLERNLYFENRGNGTFREDAKYRNLDGTRDIFQGLSYFGHTLGSAIGDIDGDGDFDVIEANLAHPRFYEFSNKSRVLLQGSNGVFTDIAGDWSFPSSAAGLRYQETHTVPALGDFDEDGTLDLVISSRYNGRPTDFYWGNGDGTFRLDVFHAGLDSATDGWCVATADFDHDGHLDVATTGGLFRNTHAANSNHWLQVKAVGNVNSNRHALGATVKVHAGGKTFLRYVEAESGQGCQDSMYLSFGLGTAAVVDSIEVAFPGGANKTFAGPITADQRVWLYEDGTLLPGWSNPI